MRNRRGKGKDMKRFFCTVIFLCLLPLAALGCGNKEGKGEPTNQVKEKVKEVVTQPVKTYKAAKESLNASSEKPKAALEEQDKELNP